MTDASSPRPWPGTSLLNGGKAYVDAPLGQLHYRDLGPRDAKISMLLLHQTPMSMVEFGEIQSELAALSIRSVCPDNPGNGLSDHPATDPSIPDFADNLIALLDHLAIDKVLAAGHHTGSSIAASFAARHPDRVVGVILHGCGVFTPEDAAWRLTLKLWDVVPKEDASHFRAPFDFRVEVAKGRPLSDGELAAATWMSMGLVMQSRDIGHPACFRYDMASDLKAIAVPGLILSDRLDSIHHLDLLAAELRPDFEFQEFSDQGHWFMMAHPGRWATVAADFADRVLKLPTDP